MALLSLFLYPGCGKNYPPTINGMVFPDSVALGDTATIICQAEDPEADNLAFHWSPLDGGTFADTSAGNTVTWVAPTQIGVYKIKVEVSDGINTPVDTTVSINVTAGTAPQPPQPVTLAPPTTITQSTVDLIWTQSPDSDFARYEVHRSLQPYFTPSESTKIRVVLSVIDTTFTSTGLTPGVTYYFKVVVADTEGLSTPSNEVSAATQYFMEIAAVSLPGRPNGLDISGELALVADREGGLQIITISNPQSPLKIGSYELDDYAQANDVFAQRPYAYVAFGDSGLHVVDITNPANPVRRAVIDSVVKSAYSVYVFGPYAYISSEDKFFRVVDIHDPTQPFIRGSCILPDKSTDIFVSESYAFTACGYSGMRVVDVSSQDSPEEVLGVETPDQAYKLYVSGGYGYIATSFAGLQIFDVTRPSNPVPVASIALPGEAYDVYVSANYAYVACWDKGLQVVDVSDPRNPVILYSFELPGSLINGVMVSGNYVYLTDWNYGFIVLSQ